MSKSKVALIQSNIGLIVLLFGLVFLLVAQTFTWVWAKIRVDKDMAAVGAAIAFTGGLQWLFDTFSKPQLFKEISSTAIANERLASSGFSDWVRDSKTIDYTNIFEHQDSLVIAINYSPRLLEDYFEALERRVRKKKKFTVLALSSQSNAAANADNVEQAAHVGPNLAKIERCVSRLNNIQSGTVTLIRHDNLLKYSFVATSELVWFKLYRNSLGLATVPALKAVKPSSMYDFFWSDIDAFTKEAQGQGNG